MVRFLFVNNGGGGFAQYVNVPSGTTVGEYVKQTLGDPSEFKLRYNREIVAVDQVIEDGSRLSVTPAKIEGGADS